MSKMERDERVWRVMGSAEGAFVFKGPFIPMYEEIDVVPQAELQRVQGLLEDAKDLLERMWDYVPGGDEDTCNRYDSFVEKLK